jgi:hypothetical protein
VEFSFSIDVIQPHPYFLIRPLHGVVPANGSVEIKISFNPITLGTCTSVIRLFIAEHNYQPIETVINARAVSGMIEQKALQQAEERISTLLSSKTLEVSQRFGQTTFGATTPAEELLKSKDISPRTSKIKSKDLKHSTRRIEDSAADPVAAVLKKTFSADGVAPTLKGALLKPSEDGTLLLGSKVPTAIESGPLQGTKKLVGNLKSTQPVQPRGVGSGNVFDSGAEYISNQIKLSQKTRPSEGAGENEKVVEGLRIPQNLTSVASVNFVLTQEPGKLKPKDLKVAIERNREERRRQEMEQARIREEGGGGSGGGLDLRAILADERLNSEPGDAFKRQLREMAFLSDMEERKKEEVEKTFRVSEEFIGATILTADDLEIVKAQRQAYRRHRNRTDWRAHLNRMDTVSHSPQSEIRAAPPTPPAQFPQNLLSSESHLILSSAPPSFDSNKNDIWGKRMNTLRKFISIVGQWIVQRRVDKRLDRLRHRLLGAGVVDRQSARAFVEADTSSPPSGTTSCPPKSSQLTKASVGNPTPADLSLASLVCSLPNQALEKMKHAETVQEPFAPTAEMCRRALFPKFVVDEVAARKPMATVPVDDLLSFDDRTFSPLRTRAEYLDLGYERESTSLCPVHFPPMAKLNLRPRTGAPEERALRESAGSLYSSLDIQSLAALGCDRVFSQAAFVAPPFEEGLETRGLAMEGNSSPSQPAWLMSELESASLDSPTDRDLSLIRPQLRIFAPEIPSKETDLGWALRPTITKFEDDADTSLRTRSPPPLLCSSLPCRLLSLPGFQSVQTYLLGGHNSRAPDSPPPPGPTITDFYLPDSDLHGSGLCCSSLDHRRALGAEELAVTSLQQRLAREDYLTDSESDDDEGYQDLKPTFAGVRDILRPPPAQSIEEVADAGKGGKKLAKIAPQTPVLEPHDAFSVLDVADRKSDQVELMRDRKTLEHATHLRQLRESQANLVTNRSVFFASFFFSHLLTRLQSISHASPCQFQALPVQLPLHAYSQELLSMLENQVDPLSEFVVAR